tara:strand:- start:904 stop:1134 length:231 start_codon:yes stop_codon:yes gene_type:complete
MLTINYSYDDELNHQRNKNKIFTKEKIVLFKLIDLKQNLYFSGGLIYHDYMLNKIKFNLIKYEKDLTKYKKYNSRY